MDIYINTPGAYIYVKDQMFAFKAKVDGENKVSHTPAHKVKSIVITENAAISTQAIKLALMENVNIVFAEGNGRPFGRLWHSKMGSTTKIRKLQLVASLNETGLKWVKLWLSNKVQNQIDFLKSLKKHRTEKHGDYLQDKIERMTKLRQSILDKEGETVEAIADSLRGYEGTAGRLYFQTLSYLLPETYQFKGRSMRPAEDAFNAFLNYAYGIMYSKVETALIIAGLDPYVGFMHRDDYNQKSMVFDYIEPYRTYADRVVFKLFSAKKVNKSHTDEITNGYTLNKEGKSLLVTAFNLYTQDEKIKHKGRNQTRLNILQLDAHAFAQSLLNE